MPVPTSIADLSTTLASNSPAGNDAVGTSLDEYLRAVQGILKQQLSVGTNIASASTITVPNDGSVFTITGTTSISTINASWPGRIVHFLVATGTFFFNHSTNLVCPGAVNLYTRANDIITMINTASGTWKVINWVSTNGNPYEVSFARDSVVDGVEYNIDLGLSGNGGVKVQYHKLDAGTATASIRVDGTELTSLSMTATRQAGPATVQYCTKGNRLSVVFSGSSGASGYQIKLVQERL